MIQKCPGAEKFRQPVPEDITCPFCRKEVEIWTDESYAVCPRCKNKIIRASRPCCLDWCRYADKCI
ncbi:MAG: phosphohydrolase [Candidatus Omnitrophica bacterium]|nr:phosphohydrolase [Candidatus Omnitrophota bacterium]